MYFTLNFKKQYLQGCNIFFLNTYTKEVYIMPQSFSNLFANVVFSTKDRLPFIQHGIEEGLYK